MAKKAMTPAQHLRELKQVNRIIEKDIERSRHSTYLHAVEFGFRCAEKGLNLTATIMEAETIYKGTKKGGR